jgi:hypothetical protein
MEPVVVVTNGVRIFGKDYSPQLLPIFRKVQESFDLPVFAIKQKTGNDEVEVLKDRIILRLKEDAPEDVVAHEQMHVVLQTEGYPRVFYISTISRASEIYKLMASSFDHLIINDRCSEYGYDARAGFISHAPSYDSILNIPLPEDNPDAKCIAVSLLLHQLIKFDYYFGDPKAEHAFLDRFPLITPYWNRLSVAIQTFKKNPTPKKMWDLIEIHNIVLDQVANDLHASVKISEFVGFGPVLVSPEDKTNSADSLFAETSQDLGNGQILLRTYLKKSKILVNVVLVASSDIKLISNDLRLPIVEYATKRGIEIRILM